jgi:nucleoside 2-deoxyribosyltransferase
VEKRSDNEFVSFPFTAELSAADLAEEAGMARCFVMQPFDGAVFDKRYDDVLAPAIDEADLEPYRVDRDPNVSIPIDELERGIQDSAVCLAEITSDNPNVWFELGYAIACQKEVVLICSTERKRPFPFDVQHRSIIRYSPESTRDFRELAEAVTARLKAALTKERRIERLSTDSPLAATEGLTPQEIVALVIVMENSLDPDSPPTHHAIKTDMDKAGYTDIAAVLSVRTLLRKGLIESVSASTYNGEPYSGYLATQTGENWLIANQDRLVLQKIRSPKVPARIHDEDDDPPF